MKTRFMVLALMATLIPLSFFKAPFPEELILQHILTVMGIALLAVTMTKVQISRFSFFCLIAFLLLHIIGARWSYSSVPYDAWAQWLTGETLSEQFGWQRNHYDRLVHIASGLFGVPPSFELLRRYSSLGTKGAALTAISIILSIGALYEILEWFIAVWLSPEHAEAYNGQQGDVWDPQKDMVLALLGAALSAFLVFRRSGK